VVGVLRGRSDPVQVGRVWFYHLSRHKPRPGMVNVAWIKDLRSQQLADLGWHKDYLEQARTCLGTDRERFLRSHAFVAPTGLFAEEVMRWYGTRRPWTHFANYPHRRSFSGGSKRRDEIVYIDNASTYFDGEFYCKVVSFLGRLLELSSCHGALVLNKRFYQQAVKEVPLVRGVRLVPINRYDFLSRYGLLLNLTGFRGAVSCLPRKLLTYLHCDMVPLIHAGFCESVQYCRGRGIRPNVYWGPKDLAAIIKTGPRPTWDRAQFCIDERIGDLVAYLEGII
jgi:hypothetical protein